MFEFLTTPGVQLIISIFFLIWSMVWVLLAMWKSAKKNHAGWFLVVFLSLISWYLYPGIITTIIGLFAVIPILYFFILSRIDFKGNRLVFEKWGRKNNKVTKKKS